MERDFLELVNVIYRTLEASLDLMLRDWLLSPRDQKQADYKPPAQHSTRRRTQSNWDKQK